jgi:anaerobic ribonucleoside-triphosphate reductase activating protein
MLKYANVQVVFQEFPGETTLAINITGCPNHCPGCHSPHLWKDEGYPLNEHELEILLRPYNKPGVITCVGFMGGDQDCNRVQQLAQWVKMNYPHLKTGWYSGNNFWSDEMMYHFDYVKFGSYKKDLGGLNSPTTNQVMYKHIYNDSGTFSMWLNITKYFWQDTPKDLKDLYIKITYNNIAIIHRVTSKTSLFTMVGLTTDGYETKLEGPTEEDFVKGYIMSLNGQTPPEKCMTHEYRRKVGETEWKKFKPICQNNC